MRRPARVRRAHGETQMKAVKKEGIERVGKSYIRAERYGRRMKAALKKAAAKNQRQAGKAAAKEQ